jgi:hypothetical protein
MEVDMTATQAQINGGKLGRDEGFAFEDEFAKHIGGFDVPENVDSIFGDTTRSKTDVLGPNGEQFSVKNSEKSTQISVCSLDRFLSKIDVPDSIRAKLEMFFGTWDSSIKHFKDQQVFLNECKRRGINTENLSQKDEIRRNRFKATSIDNFQEVIDWFHENRAAITRFIFQEGFIAPHETQAFADKVAWVEKKNSLNGIKIYEVDKIVSQTVAHAKTALGSKAATTIRCGAWTVQMKGSGKKGSAYHNVQFNCKRTDLEKYLNL